MTQGSMMSGSAMNTDVRRPPEIPDYGTRGPQTFGQSLNERLQYTDSSKKLQSPNKAELLY